MVQARFVMVSRDAATGSRSAPLNPLVTETLEEVGRRLIALITD